ncbi:MAG: hypothetical protein ACK5CA_01680 [Cyanobacteriota bacterium]
MAEQVEALALAHRQDSQRLLIILRTLERLHRHIRLEWFEPSLPNTRHDLYRLLRDIEEEGGWPYIERGKLQQLIQHLEEPEEEQT